MEKKRSVARKGTRKAVVKTPDIRTVAALAKVSIATVSRTINGSSAVRERLSKRVWKAIEQLNYFPNSHARALVSGRSRFFGIIVENITNPFFPELIQSFEEVAIAHGYEILISSSNSDPAILANCVRRMLERKVEGVAVLSFGAEEPVLDELVHRNIPIVLAEFRLEESKVSTILLDYSTGIHAAIRHLVELGHSKIAFLSGPHKLHSAITRENDYRSAMKANGVAIKPSWVIECDHTLKGGVVGFGKLQNLSTRPTAILCSNDVTAIGVLRAAYMEGLRVYAAATHHDPAVPLRSGAGGLRGPSPASRGSRQPQNAARIPGFHQPCRPRIYGRTAITPAITGPVSSDEWQTSLCTRLGSIFRSNKTPLIVEEDCCCAGLECADKMRSWAW